MNDDAIRLVNISKSFYMGGEKNIILNNISLTLNRGCFTAISGPSGSGKSTLLNILAALDTPDSGEYFLNGQWVNLKSSHELSKMRKEKFGFVFQSFNLIPVLNAVENIELPLSIHGKSKSYMRNKALELLDAVGLSSKAKHRPGQMSGGEQQRVAIARSLITDPEFVFADEPSANLDRKNTHKIIDVMSKLNSDLGVSFVFASHDDVLVSSATSTISIEDGVLCD